MLSPRSMGRLRPLWPLLVVVLFALLLPTSAFAVQSYTVEFKAHPSVFKENTEVEVPLYLVENRAPDVDQSRFSMYPSGVRELIFNFGSVQSRFVEFTPSDAFDGRGTDVPTMWGFEAYENRITNNEGRSRLYVRLASLHKASLPHADNSGITGRTELFIGTLRIAVGSAIPVGTTGRKIVLDVNFDDDVTHYDPKVNWWKGAPGATNYGDDSFMSARQVQVFTDPEPPEGIAPGDGGTPGDAGTPGGIGAPGGGTPSEGGAPGGAPAPGPTPGEAPAAPGGSPAAGAAPGIGTQAPGASVRTGRASIASARFSGKLKAAKKATRSPFTVLTKAPKKGQPRIMLRLAAPTKLKATLAKVAKKGKLIRVKGTAAVPKRTKTVYLKLTGSWNKKRLTKGTYRMTLTPPKGKARSVTFRVR